MFILSTEDLKTEYLKIESTLSKPYPIPYPYDRPSPQARKDRSKLTLAQRQIIVELMRRSKIVSSRDYLRLLQSEENSFKIKNPRPYKHNFYTYYPNHTIDEYLRPRRASKSRSPPLSKTPKTPL